MSLAIYSPVVPASMLAAVYRGESRVFVETVPVPQIGPGELLVCVESCGICHTDLKKIEYNLLAAPRIFGHETAGTVVAVGAGVTRFLPGDRVLAFHHVPCGSCFYCDRKLYAQCPVYKRVGITAGFEPSGGGFAQYVRVMDWITERGVVRVPDSVSFDVASFVEPVNTCLKAVAQSGAQPDDVVVVLGQGPIGLIFTMLLSQRGCRVIGTDMIGARRELGRRFGAVAVLHPREENVEAKAKELTDGRGADLVIAATSAPGLVEQAVRCSRPGASIVLFAQTSAKERIELGGADICVGERMLMGSYSASLDLQQESADLVFNGTLPVGELISHRFTLPEIESGIALALHPTDQSLKIVIQPQRCGE